MANGDVYTQDGEEWVIDQLDTAFSTTWQMQSGVGTTTPDKADTGCGDVTGCPAKATPGSAAKSQPSADILQFVGVISYTSTLSITEVALFTPGGTYCFQHHVFGAVTPIGVVNGDSIEFTIKHEQA